MLFDEVILAVAKSEKKSTLFSVEERTDMAKIATQDIKNIRVVPFSCLLVNFMQRMDSQIVIRGLRAVSDYEYELQLALMNRKLDPKLDTVFLMPSQQFIFLSSSMVREIASLGGDVSKFVPPAVYERLSRNWATRLRTHAVLRAKVFCLLYDSLTVRQARKRLII
ncbi:MAG: pantetheine-phosphate adenylyltransferase [Geovibrio sp.]|nr:pantetheine-phosphate adenylyltransferase [Geovibrio sp.]